MITVYRGMRIRREESAKALLNDGMNYYWENSERAVSDIFRVLRIFNKISKLGNTPILRDHVLEACRPNRLQIWGTQSKNNANSYARASPELIYLVLCDLGIERKKINKYLNERYGEPYVVTFSVDVKDYGQSDINAVYGRFIEPERILCVEKVDTAQPDPYFAKFRDEKVVANYITVGERK